MRPPCRSRRPLATPSTRLPVLFLLAGALPAAAPEGPAEQLLAALRAALGKAQVVAGKLDVERQGDATRVRGDVRLWQRDSRVTATFGAGPKLTGVRAEFAGVAFDVGLLQGLCGGALTLPDGLSPDAGIELHLLELSFADDRKVDRVQTRIGTKKGWAVVESGAVAVRDLRFILDVQQPGDSARRKVTCHLAGRATLGGAACDLAGTFDPKDKAALHLRATLTAPLRLGAVVADLGGPRAAAALQPLPATIKDLGLARVSVWSRPYAKTAGLSADSTLGRVDLVGTRTKQGTDVVAAFTPSGGGVLARVHASLAPVDKLLHLDDQTLVVSTGRATLGPGFDAAGLAQQVVGAGLNLVARLDPGKLKLDRILGSAPVRVHAEIPFPDPAGLTLQVDLHPDLALGRGAALKEAGVVIRPNPTNFEVQLRSAFDVVVDRQRLPLAALAGFDVTSQTLQLEASTRPEEQTEWKDPLGLRGAAVRDLAVAAGVTFGTGVPLPTLGFAGTLRIGQGPRAVTGKAAFLLNPREPNNSMLAFELSRLSIGELVQLAAPEPYARLRGNPLAQALFGSSVRDLNVRVAPTAVTLGDLHFEAGFLAAATVDLLGLKGRGRLQIDKGDGLTARVELEPLRLAGGAVTVTGFGRRRNPVLDLALTARRQALLVNGDINLGKGFFVAGGDLFVQPGALSLAARGKIHGALAASLRASARGNPADLKSSAVQLEVTIDSSLADLQKRGERILRHELRKHIAEVQKAQADVAAWRGVDWTARERAAHAVIAARRQQQLASVEQAAQRQKNAARAAWQSTGERISKLQASIKTKSKQRAAALKKVRVKRAAELQGQITKATAEIGKLEVERRTKKAAYDALDVTKKVTAARNRFIPVESEPEMLALRSEQASRKAAGTAALVVLKGYEQAAQGTRKAALWISRNSRKALTLEHAHFATALSAVSGGFVELALTGTFLGERLNARIRVDLRSPEELARGIVSRLLDGKRPEDRVQRLVLRTPAARALAAPGGLPQETTAQVLERNRKPAKPTGPRRSRRRR